MTNNTKVILSAKDIEICVDKIAKHLLKSDFIHIICILEGAIAFTNDICTQLTKHNKPHHISYIKIKSTDGIELLDKATIEYSDVPKYDFFDKNTSHFIVDDLIDSGKSMQKVYQYMQENGYKDIKKIALLNKYKNCNIADIIGCDLEYSKDIMEKEGIKDYWLFGYGMDLYGKDRELKDIQALVLKNE